MKRRFGFTLIELVMVIIILGILAAVTLPKFANFKTSAIESSEDAIAGAINTAIKIYQTSYIIAGGNPAAYPAVNPFSLLAQAPPYISWTTIGYPDGVTWRDYDMTGAGWYLFCPHWDGGNTVATGYQSATKGRFYVYKYPISVYFLAYQAGDFFLTYNLGH